MAKECPNPPQAWGVAPAPTLIPTPTPAPSPSPTPTPPKDLSSGAGPPVVPTMAACVTATLVDAPASQVTDDQAPLFPPLPLLSSASSWGSMADLRDNELSPMDDSCSLPVENVNDKMESNSSKSTTVSGMESTGDNDSNTSNVVIESISKVSNESMKSSESMKSNENMESKKVKSKNVVGNDVELMDKQEDASQSILKDSVTHRCGEGPQSVSSGSDLVSVSLSGSLVYKRSLADPSADDTARTKKVAKESRRKARKPSSAKVSSQANPPGSAKHVGLPSSISAVPPRSRAR